METQIKQELKKFFGFTEESTHPHIENLLKIVYEKQLNRYFIQYEFPHYHRPGASCTEVIYGYYDVKAAEYVFKVGATCEEVKFTNN